MENLLLSWKIHEILKNKLSSIEGDRIIYKVCAIWILFSKNLSLEKRVLCIHLFTLTFRNCAHSFQFCLPNTFEGQGYHVCVWGGCEQIRPAPTDNPCSIFCVFFYRGGVDGRECCVFFKHTITHLLPPLKAL